MRRHFKLALENIARYGDTDVFPYPVENYIFFDKPTETLAIIEEIHSNFDEALLKYPPINESNLSVVGYTGFRWATQIDSIWNAYLLGVVISIAQDIEQNRLSIDKNIIFSYRFQPDLNDKTLFNREIGWTQFQKASAVLAEANPYVLACDISDFYPRIYHHRIENALKKITQNSEAIRRVKELLKRISKGVSYGLPIGGPAARILSELLLSRIDRLLLAQSIQFCRFADDYHIFASTREEAYEHLVFLSQKLLENEGLSLQKSKTRIMTAEEFLMASEFVEINKSDDVEEENARRFLSLHLHYDPYSPTPEEDYEELRNQLNQFDVTGMLAREIRKSRIHQSLTRKLINSVKHLDSDVKNSAIKSLIENLAVLYPVFPNVMLLLKAVINDIEDETREMVFNTIRDLIRQGSYIIQVPVNLGFALRVLAYDKSDEADEVLSQTYQSTSSMMIRRDIILIMTFRDADYWLSDVRKNFYTLTPWEKRAMIIASYILEDEGKHWRDQIKNELTPIDQLVLKWAAEKKSQNNWSIPL